jgi:cellulose synthase/poly-beta-1,6-N-acetylglucosamine synthase-like glycosyltransferase
MQDAIRKLLLVTTLLFFLGCIVFGSSNAPYMQDIIYWSTFSYLGFIVVRHIILFIGVIASDNANVYKGYAKSSLVSIIMPAYNEEAVIEDALYGLLDLYHNNIEIIVVDDGSTDRTESIVRAFAKLHPEHKIRVYTQSNAGKSSALNTGIFHACGDFVLCVDADSRLNPEALENALYYFKDPSVGAVGGFVAVRNTDSIVAQFQQLEYLLSLNFTRKALSFFGAVTIIPGPIGLFRTEAIHSVRGYREVKNVFAEDADLTIRLLTKGWRVKGDTAMISATEVPEDIFSVLRQRYRWKRGIFQAFFDNFRKLIVKREVRSITIALYLGLEALLLPVLNFGLTLLLLAHFIAYGEIQLILKYYLVFLMLDFSVFVYSYRKTKYKLRSFFIYIIEKFTYSYLMQAWGILALLDEWRSSYMSWDKVDRIGQASQSGAKV